MDWRRGGLQVRGVDKSQPNKIQVTKLAYVSNATFKDEEIADLVPKLRQDGILVRPAAPQQGWSAHD